MGVFAIIEKAVCVGVSVASFYSREAGTTCGDDKTPTALTTQGVIQGYTEADTGNHVFLGIPFAATTAGSNR
jgi:hypothetical protein